MNNVLNGQLVSVCINAYNSEKYICQTIDSVLNQTYRNLQIIIVDDGSTDGTLNVIKQNFNDDRLEIYSRKQNFHISYTCNEAISYARGEYVFHLDSDDLVSNDLIEKQVLFLEKNKNFAACFTDVEIIDDEGNIADSSYNYLRSVLAFNGNTQAEYIRHFFYELNCLSHSGSMVRKSVLDEIGGHDYSMSYLHDFDLWTRIIIKYPIFVFKEPLTFYRKGNGIGHSILNEKKFTILKFESVWSIYRMINDCPDKLFLEAFNEELKFTGPHTHEETEIEKAFLLLNVKTLPPENKMLGIIKFKELFKEKKYVDLAFRKFGFKIYDLLKYEEQNQFYDFSEIRGHIENEKGLQRQIEEYQKQIEELQYQLNEYAIAAKHYSKVVKMTLEYHIYNVFKKIYRGIKHIKNFLSIKKDGRKYKKKVFLYGYYRMNLGDDLFFKTIIERYPDVLFLVIDTPEYYKFFSKFQNVKFYFCNDKFVNSLNSFGKKLGIYDLFEHLLLIRSDAVVHIGGSIYKQTEDYIRDYKIRKRRSGIGRHFFSISSNFGPYYSDDFYCLWKKMFRKSYDICFRDKCSKQLFNDLNSVRYAPDVLFSFRSKSADVIPQSVSISVINPCFEGRNIPDDIAEAYKKAIVNTVISLLKKNRIVNLVGFCRYEQDDIFIDQVLCEIPDSQKKCVNVFNYNLGDYNAIISVLSSSEFIIGTRLHSVILGIAMGKKVLPIVYDSKIFNILNDIKYSGKTVFLNSIADYQNAGLDGFLDELHVFDAKKLENADDLQFEKLDGFVRG